MVSICACFICLLWFRLLFFGRCAWGYQDYPFGIPQQAYLCWVREEILPPCSWRSSQSSGPPTCHEQHLEGIEDPWKWVPIWSYKGLLPCWSACLHWGKALEYIDDASSIWYKLQELRERKIGEIVKVVQAAARGWVERKHFRAAREKSISARIIQVSILQGV